MGGHPARWHDPWLDDLEVALQLPVGDRLAKLSLFPLAGGCEVIHKGVSEQGAGGGRALEGLSGIPEAARQGRLGGKVLGVGVPLNAWPQFELLLDTQRPEPNTAAIPR